MSERLLDVGEFGLIKRFRKMSAPDKTVICGIGDDAAVLELNRKEYQLFTTDMLVEDVHFRKAAGGRHIGHKALACNISDIAAMGGIPTHAVISLGVRPQTDSNFVMDVYAGIHRLAKKFGVAIVGGDTVQSEKMVINIALLGRVEKKRLVTRKGARAGDVIFVSGALGRSLSTGKHLSFTPRVAAARFLVEEFKPTAMIDISDGLAADLNHILEESRLSARIDASAIPLNPRARLNNALYDGEDFELLFTLCPTAARRLLSRKQRYKFYKIGEMTASCGPLQIRDADGMLRHIRPGGFKHF